MDQFTIVNQCIAFIARRNSGKSYLLRYLLSLEIDKFKKVFCCCPTEAVNHFYSKFIPENQIMDKYDDAWCGKLINKLTEHTKTTNKKSYVLLILDDCISDANFHNSPNLEKILTRGRHLGLSCLITSQRCTGIPPIVRNNCNYIFCGQMNRKSVDIIADEFMCGDLDRNQFLKLYNKSVQNYNFFVINANSVKDSSDLNQIYGSLCTPPEYIK